MTIILFIVMALVIFVMTLAVITILGNVNHLDDDGKTTGRTSNQATNKEET